MHTHLAAHLILTATTDRRRQRLALAEWRRHNDAGRGFDASPDLAHLAAQDAEGQTPDWTRIAGEAAGDVIAVYRDGADAILVGDAHGPWAVRLEGLVYSDELARTWIDEAGQAGDLETCDTAAAAIGGDEAARAFVVGWQIDALAQRDAAPQHAPAEDGVAW
jgi:hypothetical protein